MMLCVIGLPFNFCFNFMKNISTFHLSVIPCSSIEAIVIKFVRKSIRG